MHRLSHSHRATAWRVSRQTLLAWCLPGVMAFCVLGAAGLLVARHWKKERAAADLLIQSARFEHEENWPAAADCLVQYLHLKPEADEQRIQLASLSLKTADSQETRDRAIDLVYRALGTGRIAHETPLRRSLAELLLANERFIEAETQAANVLQLAPEDALALRVRAVALVRQYQSGALNHENPGRLPVIEWLDQARAANPGDIELAELSAEAYRHAVHCHSSRARVSEEKRIAQANACLDQLVEQRPDDPQAWLARYRYRTKWQLPGAGEDIAQAAELAPENGEIVLLAAESAHREGESLDRDAQQLDLARIEWARERLSAARKLYQRLIDAELLPEPSNAYLALGDVLIELREPDEAAAVWRRGLQATTANKTAFYARLADHWLAQNAPQRAEAWLDRMAREIEIVSATQPRDARLTLARDQDLLRGVWRMKRDEPRLATPHLRNVIFQQTLLGGHSDQSFRALVLLGETWASLGEWQLSGAALDRAGDFQPRSASIRLAAAASHIAARRVNLAVQRAEQAVRLENSSRSWLLLAQALYEQQSSRPAELRDWSRFEQAIQMAERLRDDGTLLIARDFAELQASYLALRQGEPKLPHPPISLEALHRMEWPGLRWVHKSLEDEHDKDFAWQGQPADPAINFSTAMVQSHVRAIRGEYELAEETLLNSLGDANSLRRMEAYRELYNLRVAQGQLDEARAVMLEMVSQSPHNAALVSSAAQFDLDHGWLDEIARREADVEANLPW